MARRALGLLAPLLLVAACSDVPPRHLDDTLGNELRVPLELDRPTPGPMSAPDLAAPPQLPTADEVIELLKPPAIQQVTVAEPIGRDPQDGDQGRVERADYQGNDGLWYSEGFDRTWRLLGSALDHLGLLIEDRDRSKGIYYIKVAVDEESNAFLEYFGAERKVYRVPMQVQLSRVDARSRIELLETQAAANALAAKQMGIEIPPDLASGVLGRLAEQLR